jgi:hypothetical protein
LLTFFQVVGNGVDTLVGDLRDVQQAVFTRHDLHDGAEVQQLQDGTVVALAHFDRGGQFFDAALGFLAGGGVDRGDRFGIFRSKLISSDMLKFIRLYIAGHKKVLNTFQRLYKVS